ncbi:MAG TPA: glutamate synthase-related protein, partial [Patescibacteria group bacterium]|nr:glutamate synthase-related protein [Patescibacteria group bacterium]
ALLGAEEFGFGTATLVALGCDMARQCHLDTCPTGIATQRPDLRAKFSGTPEQVERFALAVAEDLRRELAAIGALTVGEVVGEGRRFLTADDGPTDLAAVIGAGRWDVDPDRRADRGLARLGVGRAPASATEHDLVARLAAWGPAGSRSATAGGAAGMPGSPFGRLAIGTADRSFGAELSGAIERREIRRPEGTTLRLDLRGSAGQSFGAFVTDGVELHLVGQANDYLGKGLSGGVVVVRPEPEVVADPSTSTLAGNVCLFGATAGRLHVVGRAGMRFAVRNSGADAVVEGLGAHGCEYMTGGVVVVLGPVGANFGAGMTGGRAYLLDPTGRSAPALAGTSVAATRLSAVLRDRADGAERVTELRRLIDAHAAAGSELAERLGLQGGPRPEDVWLVEPVSVPAGLATAAGQAVDAVGVGVSIVRPDVAIPVATRSATPASVPTLS